MGEAEPKYIEAGRGRVEQIEGPLLIQLPDWIRGADGNQYNVVWGRAAVLKAEEVLGVKPHNSANWFLSVGSGERRILIAGCRVHYVSICPVCPEGGNVYNAEDMAKTHRWAVTYKLSPEKSGVMLLTVARTASVKETLAARLGVGMDVIEIVEAERI